MPVLGSDVQVKISTKSDLKGIDKVEKRLGKLSGVIGKFKANFGAAGAVSGGFLAGLGAIGKAAISVASDFEQNRISFETMLGSTEEAGKLLKEVSDFAIKTPFELPGVVEASKQLLAMGGTSQDVLPDLKMLGDTSAGLGVPLERLVVNFGQVRLQGKLTGRELKDFAVAGVPLIDELASSLGVAKEQVSKMVSAGEIGFPEVRKAFENMTKEGGKFGNLMEKQSKTFSGVMSNVKDSIIRSLAEIAGVSIEEGGKIREGSLFAVLKNLSEKLLTAIETVTPKVVSFFKWITNNQQAVAAIAGAIGGLLVLAVGALLLAIGPALVLMAVFTVAGAAIGALAITIVKQWNEFKDKFVRIWEGISGFITEKWNFLKENWAEVIGFIIGFMVTLPIKLPFLMLEAVAGIIKKIKEVDWDNVWQIVFDKAKDKFDKILAAGKNLLERLKAIKWGELFKGIGKGIANAVIGLVEGAIKGAMSGIPGIPDFNLPRFQFGGIVPGPIGKPQLAVVHGGEEVVPAKRNAGRGSAQIVVNQTNTIREQVDMNIAFRELGWRLATR